MTKEMLYNLNYIAERRWLNKEEFESVKNYYDTLTEKEIKNFKNKYVFLNLQMKDMNEYKTFLNNVVIKYLEEGKPDYEEAKDFNFSVSEYNVQDRDTFCILINNDNNYPFTFFHDYVIYSTNNNLFNPNRLVNDFLNVERKLYLMNSKVEQRFLSDDDLYFVKMIYNNLKTDKEKEEFKERFRYLDTEEINWTIYKMFLDQVVYELKKRTGLQNFYVGTEIDDYGHNVYAIFFDCGKDFEPLWFADTCYKEYKDSLNERLSFNFLVNKIIETFKNVQ